MVGCAKKFASNRCKCGRNPSTGKRVTTKTILGDARGVNNHSINKPRSFESVELSSNVLSSAQKVQFVFLFVNLLSDMSNWLFKMTNRV